MLFSKAQEGGISKTSITSEEVFNLIKKEGRLIAKNKLTAAENTLVKKTDATNFATKSNFKAINTKLSNVVKNDVVKKTEYNTLKTKVDDIDLSKCV